jgi:glycerol uptake facilitator-like aquaporin
MSYQNSPTGEEEISPLVSDTGNEIRKKYSYWHSGDWKANPRAIFTEFVGTMLFVFSLTMSGVVANKTPGLGFGSAVLGTAGSLVCTRRLH